MVCRLGIAISGALSLGPNEAGGLYEIIRAIGLHYRNVADSNLQIKVDVLTGASAGSTTAAIISCCRGLDRACRLREHMRRVDDGERDAITGLADHLLDQIHAGRPDSEPGREQYLGRFNRLSYRAEQVLQQIDLNAARRKPIIWFFISPEP